MTNPNPINDTANYLTFTVVMTADMARLTTVRAGVEMTVAPAYFCVFDFFINYTHIPSYLSP